MSTVIEISERATLGRPIVCTPEITETICNAVREGLPVAKAAALAGVCRTNVYRWIERGSGKDASENSDSYRHFYQQYQKAKADLQISMLSVLTDATKGGAVVAETTTERPDGTVVTSTKYSTPQWTPAAWILERRFPQEFGRNSTQKIEHSGTIRNENLNLNIGANLSDTQAVQLMQLLGKATGILGSEQ